VRLRLEDPCVLRVEADDGATDTWPLAEISVSPRLGSTPRILRMAGGGQIECDDSPLLETWFPTARESRVEAFADWLERRRGAIAAAALGTVLATVGFIHYGVPWLALRVSEHMPASVERHLSSQVEAVLDRMDFGPSALSQTRQAALRERFADLVRGEPRAEQMRLRLVDAKGIGPNAFALPDGRIFMTDQLVALAKNDDELMAVLAHEAGHHVHRHGLRQTIESSSVFVATGLLFGDASGSSMAVALPAVLLTNGFSRDHEREADAYAFALLRKRGISPKAFAAMLRRLSETHGKAGDEAGVVGYLSTHPPTPERIRAAETAGQAGP